MSRADSVSLFRPAAGRFSSLTSKFSNLTTSGQKGASTTRPAMPTISSDENSPITSEAEDDVAPLSAPGSVPPSAVPEIKGVAKGDLTFASSLRLADVNATDPVEAALGAWRFSDPVAEPMEDNLFVFQDESVPVAKRRKHFSKAEALRNFTYDPDVWVRPVHSRPSGCPADNDVPLPVSTAPPSSRRSWISTSSIYR